MPFTINIQHLEQEGKEYDGDIPVDELDLDAIDDLIHPQGPLNYRLTVEKHETNLLIQGEIEQTFECECSRCLKKYELPIMIPDWSGFVALEGEESLPVNNDMVDLTAVLREDILLVLPQHPVCERGCKGLGSKTEKDSQIDDADGVENSSPWNALDHLNLEKDKD
jgi:uncharacterized metal-binding protein YceD (DUF177 family)